MPRSKVFVSGFEQAGIGEIASLTSTKVTVRFYTNALAFKSLTVVTAMVRRAILPTQTRCYRRADGATRYGRVIGCQTETSPLATYLVQSAGEETLSALREDEFSVRSYLPADGPLDVLANLANETPFFFVNRAALLRELFQQRRLAHGLPALLSSKIDILPHQVQIADRVLRDPVIRYLLADEVGLGKTIEAGLVLRQLKVDAPETRIAVFVPDQLVQQWSDELIRRFEISAGAPTNGATDVRSPHPEKPVASGKSSGSKNCSCALSVNQNTKHWKGRQ